MIQIVVSISALIPIMTLLFATVIRNSYRTKLTISTGKFILFASIISGTGLLAIISLNQNVLSSNFGIEPLHGLLRFDTLSTTMFLMVSIIGLIVLQFSKSYLQGDTNQIKFICKLLHTIAFVQLLMLSGSLFVLFFSWVATSISLQYLISFYRERKETREAVKKKFLIARISDLSLFVALIFLYLEFRTSDLAFIFQELMTFTIAQASIYLELSALFLVLAAITKSVQVPFHGWLLDVMEAPTPVSGLLHAGLLNAGPFLMIRFAYLLEVTTVAPILLLIVGGLSAIYGTIVFPTQPAIKTGLAYSSIGHMGFSLMICGMGLYSASLLHLVAHSFYKAHSFLSSGSAVDKFRLNQLKGNLKFKPSTRHVILGFLLTCALYLSITALLGEKHYNNFQIMVLGAIIIAGVSSFTAKNVTFKNGFRSILKTVFASSFVLLAFLTFETTIGNLLADQIPTVSDPGIIVKGVSIILLLLFVVIIFFSVLSTSSTSSDSSKWQIYKRNGFYIHIIFDRLLNSAYPQIIKKG